MDALSIASEWQLYIGRRFSKVIVRPDIGWPGMWRVRSPDGELSDMVNLARAKDAAISVARPRGLGRGECVHWQRSG
jgi:hypothetical protein